MVGEPERLPSQTPRQVLLVDDHGLARRTLGQRLRELGMQVVEAESTEQALAAMATSVFELAIVDWRLGGEDGLALARQLRARQPELAVTLLASPYEAEEVRSLGEDLPGLELLDKPVTGPAVQRLLSGLAWRRSPRRRWARVWWIYRASACCWWTTTPSTARWSSASCRAAAS